MEIRYVEWVDSSGRGHWHAMKEARDLVPDRCTTVGFVLTESDDYLTLIQSFTNRKEEDDNQADNAISIPKVAITKMETLGLIKVRAKARAAGQ